MTEADGLLYFTADNAVLGRELWKSNGTLEGTQLVAEIAPAEVSSTPEDLINVAGILYFTANDEVHGRELWKTNGSTAGTQLVRDIFEGPGSAYPESITNVNGELFFGAYNAADGFELWKSNGTLEGTVLLKDVLPELIALIRTTCITHRASCFSVRLAMLMSKSGPRMAPQVAQPK